jgi:hypothetical protein
MGVSGSDHAELRRCLKAGQYASACSAARSLTVVPLDAALDLTLLAAEKHPERFEAMAVRWLTRLGEERRPSLRDYVWATQRMGDVREGRGFEAGPALRRWLAK